MLGLDGSSPEAEYHLVQTSGNSGCDCECLDDCAEYSVLVTNNARYMQTNWLSVFDYWRYSVRLRACRPADYQASNSGRCSIGAQYQFESSVRIFNASFFFVHALVSLWQEA